jgi:hypothetical protein
MVGPSTYKAKVAHIEKLAVRVVLIGGKFNTVPLPDDQTGRRRS